MMVSRKTDGNAILEDGDDNTNGDDVIIVMVMIKTNYSCPVHKRNHTQAQN